MGYVYGFIISIVIEIVLTIVVTGASLTIPVIVEKLEEAPVGEGFLVYLGSSIYKEKPKPKSKFWINILAEPTNPDESDGVAEFGVRWKVKNEPNINVKLDINHLDALKMFKNIIKDKKSAYNFIYENIIYKIGK